MATVHIYSTPTCGYCVLAKNYFAKHNITYTEYNVQADLAKRSEMVEKTGQMGVPVIEIDGEIVLGFNQERLGELLGVKE